MAPSKGKHIDFIVTTSNPNDASSAADNKRRVRSVAALKSWPERRKRFFDQLEPTGACQNTFLIQRTETPAVSIPTRPRKRKSTNPSGRLTTPGDDEDITLSHPSDHVSKYRSAHGSSHVWQLSDVPQTDRRGRVEKGMMGRRKRMADGSEKTIPMHGEVALLTPPYSPGGCPSNGRADPFNCYPVEYRPWFDKILHHNVKQIAITNPSRKTIFQPPRNAERLNSLIGCVVPVLKIYCPRGWPTLKITNQEGLEWERYMTQQALGEPALFYVRLYFGSGDMVHLGVIGREVMGWLRLQAIKAINSALCDPERATSDALILAVGRIALSESLYGDRASASAIHRPAQKRMIDMRGGMGSLEIPELVKRLMRWSDRVMAMQTSTSRFLEDTDEKMNFTLEQSVKVLEKWAPREHQSPEQQVNALDPAKKSKDT